MLSTITLCPSLNNNPMSYVLCLYVLEKRFSIKASCLKWSWTLSYPVFQIDCLNSIRGFAVTQMVKNIPEMWGTWIGFLGQKSPLEKRMGTHSSILAWRIPWTVSPSPASFLCEWTSPGDHRVAKSQTWLNDFHFHFPARLRRDVLISSFLQPFIGGSTQDV